mgnify:CR=1 FL=1
MQKNFHLLRTKTLRLLAKKFPSITHKNSPPPYKKSYPITSKTILKSIFSPPSEKEIFTFEKTNSDLSPQTFNHSYYRNKSLKHSTHSTAFEGICFFKSNKFFLSVLPPKKAYKKHTTKKIKHRLKT